jgi:rubrerythrin
MEGLAPLFRRYAELELKYAEELERLSQSVKHPVLSALFTAVASDSRKHSRMYAALAELAESVTPAISEEDLRTISATVERHIATEASMIGTAKELLERVEDVRAKLVLEAILRDEVDHHKLLRTIRDAIAKAEVLGEQQLWNQVWLDSPWHGAPGG